MNEICEIMDISKELNEEQQVAAYHLQGPLLVLAGAGSGKTRCVTYRIANLINQGVSPDSILGLTFTNKAAREMHERVQNLVGKNLLICTFHRLGALILRESIKYLEGYNHNFTIYDPDDCEKLIKICIAELNIKDTKLESKTVKYLISVAKNNLEAPESLQKSRNGSNAERFLPQLYKLYQQKLKECNAVDFDDLLFLPVMLLSNFQELLEKYQLRWQYLLIDEYQDTNQAQYGLIKLLVAKHQNIFAVGDPDQSIYSWRGANIENILNFKKDFPKGKVIFLEQNYRSTQNILDASNELIRQNSRRYEKNLWSSLGEGEKIKYFEGSTEHDEARFVAERIRYYHQEMGIPLNEMVIFYRTNFQSRVFEDHLLQRSIPYIIIGGISFYQRKEIKDILAFIRMITAPSDFISFSRTINLPKRGIGNATIEKIRTYASNYNLSILDICRMIIDNQENKIDLRLSKKQKEGLYEYVKIIDTLIYMNNEGASVHDIIEAAVKNSRYLVYLGSDPETEDDRKGNINELLEKAKEWGSNENEESLSLFLEEMSLKSNLDDSFDVEDRLNLMTLHNGKGLEFQVVFIVGVEDELIPHINSRENPEDLEEERRLFYVGMTRAKKQLYFSNILTRNMWGQSRRQRPSRFINEISSKYIQKIAFSSGQYRYSERISKKEYQNFSRQPKHKEIISEEIVTFRVGEAVFHKDFGIGIIQNSYQSSLGEMVDVLFSKENKPKSLALKYAKLKKL